MKAAILVPRYLTGNSSPAGFGSSGLVQSLNFALGLGMIGRATDVAHSLLVLPLGQFLGDVAGAVVG